MSRNVLVHGGGGQVILTGITEHGSPHGADPGHGQGPGITNIAQAMSDGYSTAGTMGGGMGAMKRIADKLEIFTGRDGTIVLIELGLAPPTENLQVAGLAVPYPGRARLRR